MSEVFDLDRDTNIKNNIDAQGKKWEIHKDRTNHLLYARPAGGRADSVIPDSLQGAWTKHMLLKERIELYVKESWDHADKINQRNERKRLAALEHQQNKRKKELDDGNGETEERVEVQAEEGNDEEQAGRPEDTRIEEEKEKETVASFEGMPYDQLLLLAKESGIKSRKKAEIIEALTNGTKDD